MHNYVYRSITIQSTKRPLFLDWLLMKWKIIQYPETANELFVCSASNNGLLIASTDWFVAVSG